MSNHFNGNGHVLMVNSALAHFGGTLRARWINPRRIRFWLILLVVVYTLLGFLGVPWLVQYLAVNTAREDFGRDLRIEAVHLNPYTLTFQIDGLALDDTDDRPLLAWEQLFVDLSWSSIVNRAWTFQTIRLDEPVMQEERFTSGETRLSRLIPESKARTSEDEEAGSPLALRVEDLRVKSAVLRFADNLPGKASGEDETSRVAFALQDLDLSVDGFTLKEGASFPVQLRGQVAAGGALGFDGTLQLLPSVVLDGEARVDELALAQTEPYLRQFAGVRVDSGALNLNGQIRTAAREPLAFRGAAGIAALNILDGPDGESLVGWDSIRTERLELSLGDRQLETAPVSVEGLSGRVTIHEDQTTNFGRLIAKEAPPAAEEDDEAAGSDSGADPFIITLEAIRFTDGALRFADKSLPLPFSTSIHSLEGQISTLSSTSAQPARVNLEGQVADYGLARIGGTLHAWHPMRKTSLEVSFRNLEIPEYSPYTVQFAGRKIAGGTMDLDLNYRINDRQLAGDNNLVLRNLQLGEKIASSDAMDLPLDLAIALLKDRNGVIDLDLPVSGDVGEPEFAIGNVIRQALTRTLASIVQSPFRFLAGLVGVDSEELGRVEFPEGRSDLTPPQRERVAKLREALNQRPELVLELSGPFNETLDGPELKRDKAMEALKQRLGEAGRDGTDPSLTAEATQGLVETMFLAHYRDKDLDRIKARFREPRDESSGEAAFDALAYRNHLAEQIIAAQPVTEADFRAIANDRATAVREILVDSDLDNSISADRVRILEASEVEAGGDERIAMAIGLAPD